MAVNSRSAAGWTLLSRLTGLGRVIAIGAILGPTFFGNLFQAVALVPTLIFASTTGPVLTSVLVPPMVAMIERGDRARLRTFCQSLAGVTLVGFGLVVVIGAIASPLVVRLLTVGVPDPDIASAQRRIGIVLLILVLPQAALYTIAGIGAAVQQAHRRFALAAAAPALENVGVIATLVVFGIWFGTGPDLATVGAGQIALLGLGTTAAVGLHAAAQLVGAARHGIVLAPSREWRDPALREVLRLSVPAVGTASVQGLRHLLILIVAGAVPGGVVAFRMAINFYNLPLALGARPVASAAVPELSSSFQAGDRALLWHRWSRAISLALFLAVPAALGYLLLANPIASVLAVGEMAQSHGKELLAASIAALALGILGETVYWVCASGSFAMRQPRWPLRSTWLRAGVTGAVVLAALPLTSGRSLLIALGLGIALGDTAAGLSLYRTVARRLSDGPSIARRPVAVTFFAATAALVVGSLIARLLGVVPGRLGDTIALGFGLSSAAAVYLFLQWRFGSVELAELSGRGLRGRPAGVVEVTGRPVDGRSAADPSPPDDESVSEAGSELAAEVVDDSTERAAAAPVDLSPIDDCMANEWLRNWSQAAGRESLARLGTASWRADFRRAASTEASGAVHDPDTELVAETEPELESDLVADLVAELVPDPEPAPELAPESEVELAVARVSAVEPEAAPVPKSEPQPEPEATHESEPGPERASEPEPEVSGPGAAEPAPIPIAASQPAVARSSWSRIVRRGMGPDAAVQDVTTVVVLACAAVASTLLLTPEPLLGLGIALAASLWVIVVSRPVAAVYVYLGLAPLIAGIERDTIVPFLRPNEALLVVVGGAVIWSRSIGGLVRRARPFERTQLDVALAALAVLGSIVPLLWMVGRGLRPELVDLLYAISLWKLVAFYALARAVVETVEHIERCLRIVLAASAVVAVVAILQSLGVAPVISMLEAIYPDTVRNLANNRGSSLLDSSHAVGDVMVICLALVVGLAHHRRWTPTLVGLAGLFFFGTFASGQFSAILGLAIGAYVVVRLTRVSLPTLTMALPFTVLSGLVLGEVVKRRLGAFSGGGMPDSWSARLDNLTTFFWPELFADYNYLLGVRPAARFPAPEPWRDFVYIESGHTYLLWSGGVPFFIAYAVFTVVAIKSVLPLVGRRDAVGAAAIGAAAGLWVVTALMTLDVHLTLRGTADLLFPLLGLVVAGRLIAPAVAGRPPVGDAAESREPAEVHQ